MIVDLVKFSLDREVYECLPVLSLGDQSHIGGRLKMKVLITGGAGFIGSQLSSRFLQEGHTVVGIGRSSGPGAGFPASAKYVSGDTTRPGECQQEVRDADVIINLAGVSIFGRWIKERSRYMTAAFSPAVIW